MNPSGAMKTIRTPAYVRQCGPAIAASLIATMLFIVAPTLRAQGPAPASGTPAGAATSAGASKLSIKDALLQEFLREQGRTPEQIRWLELEQGQAMLTALHANLVIKGAELNKELSAAAFQQALAAFDSVVTQSLTYNRSLVLNRTAADFEYKGPINCVAGVCTRILGNNPGVFSITFDQGRTAGFYQTTIDASVSPDAGPDRSKAYNLQLNKLFSQGISAFALNTVTYKNNTFTEDIGFKVVGTYDRPWTNQLSAGLTAPLPGSKFFGKFAVADVAAKIGDVNQQAAYWQISALINDTLLKVEQGYWNLVLAQKNYEVTVETRERVRALAERTDRLYRLQEATRYDKTKVDAQLATLRRQEREALNGYLTASNALANLLDMGKDAILLPTSYESRIAASATVELGRALQDGQERNPQVRLAEINKAIGQLLLEQGKVQLRPDVNASASLNRNQSNSVFGYKNAPTAIGHALHPDNANQTYALTYLRPWDNRAASANFQQSEARFRQQEILLNQTRRSVASQISLAVTSLQSAQQRAEIAKRARDLAEEVFERGERQRALRVVSDFEVIAKSIDLLNADLDYQSALLGRKISEAALYAAIGTLAQRYGEGGPK